MLLRLMIPLVIVLASLFTLSCGSASQQDLALSQGVDAYTGASPKPPKGAKLPASPPAAPAADAGVKPAADAGVQPATDGGVP